MARYYVVKIPSISGFQDKKCIYDVVVSQEDDFIGFGITRNLSKLDLLEILEGYQLHGEDYLCNEPEFVGEHLNDYSDAQWNAAIKIPLDDISPEEIRFTADWYDFVHP